MNQAMEILRRRKRLFIIPFTIAFVVPVLGALIFLRSYQADTTVWLDSNSSTASVMQLHGGSQQSGTPIQSESDALKQLMQSRAFVTKIISGTELQSKMDTPRHQAKTIDYVRKNTTITDVGANAMRVSFLGHSPEEAVNVVRTITGDFVDQVKSGAKAQGAQTTELFLAQSNTYRTQLQTANAQLQAFREQHPETRQLDIAAQVLNPPTITVSAAVQTEYARLKLAADYAQKLYDQSLTDLGQAQVVSNLQVDLYTKGFRTLDEPVTPLSFALRPMALFVFMAFLAASIIGGIAVAWAEYNDRTLHGSREVDQALGLPVLAQIPRNPQEVKRA